MDIALHRVSRLSATATEYTDQPCADFIILNVTVRTDRGEHAEIKLFGPIDAPFAEIAAAINAAYAVSAAQKEEAA